ncbi:putative synthase or transferase [Streptococcus sp. DD10]|uniref:polyprenyl synthetase family protein n=1 Tax=Streptococcus sp. DD10 TaxID=1777878 RepID=UPI000799AB2A|nr:farnesyl diphosphate synthase [Streptococcus sp. DD10]KXT73653.1 putative synthase or transferase [Streptococcus sp. DD10]
MKQAEKIIQLEAAIETFYREKQVAPHLVAAILYSVRAGGKRLRPLLLLEILEALGITLEEAHFQVAGAVELIHTGSLIHDDLPAMDNDDYRRGRLTNHKKFGEDIAILAGDSLFLDPYGLIADAALSNSIKVRLISELSKAAGTAGMVAGQVLDMEGEKSQLALEQLQTIHAHKTGKLLAYPFLAAGLVAGVADSILTKLEKAGNLLGLAFQVRDDVLDLTASFEEIGKTPKKDLQAEKSTYPSLMGLDEARNFSNSCLEQVELLLTEIGQEILFEDKELRVLIESLKIHG